MKLMFKWWPRSDGGGEIALSTGGFWRLLSEARPSPVAGGKHQLWIFLSARWWTTNWALPPPKKKMCLHRQSPGIINNNLLLLNLKTWREESLWSKFCGWKNEICLSCWQTWITVFKVSDFSTAEGESKFKSIILVIAETSILLYLKRAFEKKS